MGKGAYGLRLHFVDGSSALDGQVADPGAEPTILDERLAIDVARGWPLAVGSVTPDGRRVTRSTVEWFAEATAGVRDVLGPGHAPVKAAG